MVQNKHFFWIKLSRAILAGMVAHPVMQTIGELSVVDILDLSKVSWICFGVFLHQQWAGAEDGKGFRLVAGTGKE